MDDDRWSQKRWRFPHQSEDWFGMTRSDDAPNSNLSNHKTIPSGAQRQNDDRPGSSRLGRPPCGQIPIFLHSGDSPCIPRFQPTKNREPLSVPLAAQKEVPSPEMIYLSACFMDRLMRRRFSSTDSTMTFTTSPTCTASLGWRRRRLLTSEICTRPS